MAKKNKNNRKNNQNSNSNSTSNSNSKPSSPTPPKEIIKQEDPNLKQELLEGRPPIENEIQTISRHASNEENTIKEIQSRTKSSESNKSKTSLKSVKSVKNSGDNNDNNDNNDKESNDQDKPLLQPENEQNNTQSNNNSRNNSKESNKSNTKNQEASGSGSESEESSSDESETDPNQPQSSWWSVISTVATEVGAAVVAGVKEEIEEIKEDIETVASASVEAGKQLADYSSVAGEKMKVASSHAAEAGKEFLQTDLTEFGRVLGEETTETVKDVKEVSSIIGGAVTGWMGSISTMVANSNLVSSSNYYDDYDQSGIIIGKNKQKINFVSAFEARVHNLRTDTSTYCVEPEDESDYELWRETFDLDSPSTKTTISDLLVASQEVRSLYTKLVPSAVAHQVFWQRYFYKLDALERAERRRTALMERAGKSEEEDDEDLSWGGDSDEDGGEHSKEQSPRNSGLKVQKEKEIVVKKDLESNGNSNVVTVEKVESEKSDSPVIISNENKKEDKPTEEQEDDWEKEFDIDMTEAEIQAALNDDGSDNLDDWD